MMLKKTLRLSYPLPPSKRKILISNPSFSNKNSNYRQVSMLFLGKDELPSSSTLSEFSVTDNSIKDTPEMSISKEKVESYEKD